MIHLKGISLNNPTSLKLLTFIQLSKVEVKSLSRVLLFATVWTVAYHDSPSVGFSRQEYWSGLPFPSPGDLPNPGIEPGSPALQADKPPGHFSELTPAVPPLLCSTGPLFYIS